MQLRDHIRHRLAEQRAIRAELTALSERARNVGLLSIAVVIDLALALDSEDGRPRAN